MMVVISVDMVGSVLSIMLVLSGDDSFVLLISSIV